MGQDAFVDVGLTWRVTPEVSEGRANRTTVRTRVSTSWWEAIVGKLLREIGEKVLNNFLPLILEVQVVVYTTRSKRHPSLVLRLLCVGGNKAERYPSFSYLYFNHACQVSSND